MNIRYMYRKYFKKFKSNLKLDKYLIIEKENIKIKI